MQAPNRAPSRVIIWLTKSANRSGAQVFRLRGRWGSGHHGGPCRKDGPHRGERREGGERNFGCAADGEAATTVALAEKTALIEGRTDVGSGPFCEFRDTLIAGGSPSLRRSRLM